MRLFFLLLLVAAVSTFPKNENFLPPEEDDDYSSTSSITEQISTDASTTEALPASTSTDSSGDGGSTPNPVTPDPSATNQPTTTKPESSSKPTGSSTTDTPGTETSGATKPTTKPTSPSDSTGTTTTTTLGAAQTTTTTGPPTAKPFDVKSQTFPNDVNVISAKLILQEAIQLSNQINDLSQQIVDLQASIDPDNSYLILNLYAMQNTSNELQANLTSIQKDLNVAVENMNPVINRYNNVSRVFSCYLECQPQISTTVAVTTALFTGTPPTPSCDQNFTAKSAVQTYNSSYQDQHCSLRIDADNGHIYLDFTGTTDKANFTVTDLNTASELTPKDNKLETSTTSLKIDINADDEGFDFKLQYKYIDPCTPDGKPYCDTTSAECKVNAAGQPYCVCSETCTCCQPNSDGISCAAPQCSKVAKKNCTTKGQDCIVKPDPSDNDNCNAQCVPSNPSFLERWLLP